MKTILRIAIGNIWANRSKMILLVALIVLGVTINILANAFLAATRNGLERDFRENYTGDLVIRGASPYPVTLFTVAKPVFSQSLEPLPELTDVDRVRGIVGALDEVREATTLITGMGIIGTENVSLDFEPAGGNSGMVDLMAYIFSGDGDRFWKMFPAYRITEGSYPLAPDPTVMVSEETRKAFVGYYEIPLNVGDKIILQGISDTINIRELTVSGFYRIEGSAAPALSPTFIDSDTARSLAGLNRGSGWIKTFELPVDLASASLGEEDLFGEDFLDIAFEEEADLSEASLTGILGGTTVADMLETNDDSWNFMLVKLKNSADTLRVIDRLNAEFDATGIGARAISWDDAGTQFTSSTGALRTLFSVFMAVIGVVVLIVTMNLLLVAIMGRVSEIGTMRAIGAGRGFVRSLFFIETVILVSVSALAGILLGELLVPLINSFNIVFEGSMVRLLLGSGAVRLMPTFGAAAASFLIILAGGIIANLYPVSVALSITPLDAMNREA
jgi:putative ABC transport system permease protein